MNQKKHHHLVCAEITFSVPNEKENLSTVKVNGVLLTKKKGIAMIDIGKAQQVAQQTFANSLGGREINLLDVVIIAISYLGEFTETEWKATPPGLQLVKEEIAPPDSFVPTEGMTLEQAAAARQQAKVNEDLAAQAERA